MPAAWGWMASSPLVQSTFAGTFFLDFRNLGIYYPRAVKCDVARPGGGIKRTLCNGVELVALRGANCHQIVGRSGTGTQLRNGHKGTNSASVIARRTTSSPASHALGTNAKLWPSFCRLRAAERL